MKPDDSKNYYYIKNSNEEIKKYILFSYITEKIFERKILSNYPVLIVKLAIAVFEYMLA